MLKEPAKIPADSFITTENLFWYFVRLVTFLLLWIMDLIMTKFVAAFMSMYQFMK